jgi:hypothetical protein
MLDYTNLDRKSRVLVASSDRTPAEVLEKLSRVRDPEVRKALASNPNTPVKVLEKLGEKFPEAITGNPVFNLLLLENPDSRFVRLSLARSSTTPGETLAQLAKTLNQKDKKMLLAIAYNISTPVDVLELGRKLPEILILRYPF